MKDFAQMTAAELSEHLSRLKADLEDVEEERTFVLGQTGVHVSTGAVKKFENEVDSLKARVEEVEQLLRTKQSE